MLGDLLLFTNSRTHKKNNLMEGGWTWEQRALVNELIQGMEVAKQLRFHLKETFAVEAADSLVQRILSSYEKALMILNWSEPMGQPPQAVSVRGTAATPAAGFGVPGSPLSGNGSPRSEAFDGTKDNQVPDDASKKSTQNCWAVKQVQRSDEDPTIFEVTYRGTHTCTYGQQTVPQPASPEKQEQKHNIGHQQHPPKQDLQKGLKFNNQDMNNMEMVPFTFPSTYECPKNHTSSYTPSFLSPATPDPSYYPVSPLGNSYGGNQTLQPSDLDFADIISAHTSASSTNSPILDLDFQLEPFELVPNFAYDPGFFP